ncbi:hypothetical protein N0V90_002863 [Kalmusia sp. IMI 367209]|nr:hypothetical protein N0V90_002863 [Kalmusia sp. IMI 367209]
MKFSATIIASFAAMLNMAAADFLVYEINENNAGDTMGFPGYAVFDADPDCKTVLNYPVAWWLGSDDVSEDVGVRCGPPQGCAQRDPTLIEQLELNFATEPVYHFTIYKDREYGLIGLDGRVYGICEPLDDDDFQCSEGIRAVGGVKKFRCYSDFSAQTFIDAAK